MNCMGCLCVHPGAVSVSSCDKRVKNLFQIQLLLLLLSLSWGTNISIRVVINRFIKDLLVTVAGCW